MSESSEHFISKSLIIPVYRNAVNIPSLLKAIEVIAQNYGNTFEAIFVVDGSPDNSYDLLNEHLAKKSFSSQLIALSRNFGSFLAIRTGMEHARGKFIAVMAADLQEPPKLIKEFFTALESNSADVIFGARNKRNDSFWQSFMANSFWAIYRKIVNSEMPKGGVDIFACNQKAKEAVLAIKESHSSLINNLFWIGFRRLFIPYERKEREHGKSAWSFSKRFRYMIDSIFSFSDYPILFVLWTGVIGVFLSLIVGVATIIAKLSGLISVPGYTTIVIVVSFLGSAIMMTQGVLGCYLWHTFENTKKRPLTIVDDVKVLRK